MWLGPCAGRPAHVRKRTVAEAARQGQRTDIISIANGIAPGLVGRGRYPYGDLS